MQNRDALSARNIPFPVGQPVGSQIWEYDPTTRAMAWINTPAGGSMVYPGAGIPLSTGSAWDTSITDNSSNWNTAYGWGNHASAGYSTQTLSLGTTTQIPYMNATDDNFLYSANLMFNGTNFGIGVPALTYPFHFASGYGTFPTHYLTDTFVIFQGNLNSAQKMSLTILGKNDGYSNIYFGDDYGIRQGQINYNHSTDGFECGAGNSGDIWRWNSTGIFLPDNKYLSLGSAYGDARIYYNATNLIINPRVVGTGYLGILNDGTNVGAQFTKLSTNYANLVLYSGGGSATWPTITPTNASMFQMISNGTTGLRTASYSNTAGNASFFQFNRWRGTDASASAAQAGDAVFRISGGGGYNTGANTGLLSSQIKMAVESEPKVYDAFHTFPIVLTLESSYLPTIATSLFSERVQLTSTGNLGIGLTPTHRLEAKGFSNINNTQTYVVQEDFLMTAGGTYSGIGLAIFVVEIDAGEDELASPNTFKWNKNGGSYTTGVAITGSAQTLSDGITVTFDATTGYYLGEQWVISAMFADPFNVKSSAGTNLFTIFDTGNVIVYEECRTITPNSGSYNFVGLNDTYSSSLICFGLYVENTGEVYLGNEENKDLVFYTNGFANTRMTIEAGGTVALNQPARLKGYTVAGLPAGTQGDVCFVTDALTPTFGATVVGGGAVVQPVFYTGAAWVSY